MKATRFSERGLERNTRVDAKALSDRAAIFQVRVPVGSFTQNTTTITSGGPLGVPAKLISAYASFGTKPAGGTLVLKAVAYDASGNAAVDLTADYDPETATNREAAALSLDTTNVALAADDTIETHAIASDDTVSAAGVGGYIVLNFRPLAESASSAEFTDVGAG